MLSAVSRAPGLWFRFQDVRMDVGLALLSCRLSRQSAGTHRMSVFLQVPMPIRPGCPWSIHEQLQTSRVDHHACNMVGRIVEAGKL